VEKLEESGYLTLYQGKFREIRKSQEKVRETVVCLWCAVAVAIVT